MTDCGIATCDRNRTGRDGGTGLLVAAFWSCTFLINEGTSWLNGELPFHLAGGHRAAAFGFAALLAFAAARVLKRIGLDLRKQVVCAGVMILLVPALHAAFFFLTCKVAPIPAVAPMTLRECAVKGLLSTGYFGAWLALQLALIYHHEARRDGLSMQRPRTQPSRDGPDPDKSSWAWCRNQRVIVQAEEIRWVEAQKDYAVLHCATRSCIMRTTLSSLAAQLPADNFVRVHRSAIVRRSAIASTHRKPSGALALRTTCGTELPVGRSYVHALGELPIHAQAPFERSPVAKF